MIDFLSYRDKTVDFLCELQQSLNEEDEALIYELLSNEKASSYMDWFQNNIEEVKKFASSTPAQRKKKKKWNTYPERVYLTLGAMIVYMKAYDLLNVLLNHQDCFYGGSYREVGVEMFDIFLEIQKNRKIRNPLDFDFCC